MENTHLQQVIMEHAAAQTIAQLTEQAQNITEPTSNAFSSEINQHSSVVFNTDSALQSTPISSSPDMQRKIQDLQRIQHLQFLQKLEQQRQNNTNFGHQNIHNAHLNTTGINHQINKESNFEKVNLVNGSLNEQLRNFLGEFNRKIIGSLEQIEKIDIGDFKDKIETVVDTISKYNSSIDSWYDDKYYSDKKKFYDNIDMMDKKFMTYEKYDLISIGVTD